MNAKLIVLLIVSFCIAISSTTAEAQRATRDLVFEEEESNPAKDTSVKDAKVVAVKTTLELIREGQTTTVLPTYEFKSGDKVRVIFSTNIDGYVYWLAKGSSGTYKVLFPAPKVGLENAVKKNTEYAVPAKGSFRFDDKAGKEELLCVVSPQRLPDLDKAVAEAAGANGSDVKETAKQVASVEEKNTSMRQTRDLVFEEEDEKDVNTKSQIAPGGEPFVAYYILMHK